MCSVVTEWKNVDCRLLFVSSDKEYNTLSAPLREQLARVYIYYHFPPSSWPSAGGPCGLRLSSRGTLVRMWCFSDFRELFVEVVFAAPGVGVVRLFIGAVLSQLTVLYLSGLCTGVPCCAVLCCAVGSAAALSMEGLAGFRR